MTDHVLTNHLIAFEGHVWHVDGVLADNKLTINAVRGDMSRPAMLNSAIMMLAQSFGVTVQLDDASAREAILSAIFGSKHSG